MYVVFTCFVCNIRKAEEKDLSAIMGIYNKEIKNGIATFDTEEKTLREMKYWFKNHGVKNPVIVAETSDGIVGWASLSKYSNRCAYSDTTELSVYVKDEFQRQGIGNKLMEYILIKGKKAGVHAVIARITDGNKHSIKIHEKHGFFHVGVLKEVGNKFGKTLDVYLMQKILED